MKPEFMLVPEMSLRELRNKITSVGSLKKVVCPVPFTQLQIYQDGWVSPCCYSWLPSYIGNVNEKSLLEMINGPQAAKIQDSVRDGTYRFCSLELCPELSRYLAHGQRGDLIPVDIADSELANRRKKLWINLAYDRSCNLACPSCRSEFILYRTKDMPESLRVTHERVKQSLKELSNEGYQITLGVTGSGDPFASQLYYDLLGSFQGDANLSFHLQTNGVLMSPGRFVPSIRDLTEAVSISVDAVTEETYRKVRKGGSFSALMKNLSWFDNAITAGEFPRLRWWCLNFVVQKDNYQEAAQFAKWALEFKSRPSIWFNLIADWGHLPSSEFKLKAVADQAHAEHLAFLKCFTDPVFFHEQVRLGNVAPFVKVEKMLVDTKRAL